MIRANRFARIALRIARATKFRILFFWLGGGEGGIRGDREGGVDVFFENPTAGGGGSPEKRGWGGGPGGCLRGIGGGGGNFFWGGPKCPPSLYFNCFWPNIKLVWDAHFWWGSSMGRVSFALFCLGIAQKMRMGESGGVPEQPPKCSVHICLLRCPASLSLNLMTSRVDASHISPYSLVFCLFFFFLCVSLFFLFFLSLFSVFNSLSPSLFSVFKLFLFVSLFFL